MNILIAGANSDIAMALARVLAEQGGCHLILASRDEEELARNRDDLVARYEISVSVYPLDVTDSDSRGAFFGALDAVPDLAVLAFGHLEDQSAAQADSLRADRLIAVNFTGLVHLAEFLAAGMSERGSGAIVGIASVAGLRGRQANYLYGAAKAGAIAYLSGLRNRLTRSGVHVLTVLPGFVATKMTADRDLPGWLTASPARAARAILRGIERRRNVIYVPAIWRWIMFVIRLIPEPIFKRLDL